MHAVSFNQQMTSVILRNLAAFRVLKGTPGFVQAAKMWTKENILPSNGENCYYV